MSGSESKNEVAKKERRFSQEQYEMLLRCSNKKDMTEWNEWRKAHPEKEVLLEGANIAEAKQVSAEQEVLTTAYLGEANLSGGHLEGADLRDAHLEKVNFIGAHLEEAKLWGAHLEDACLCKAHLDNANLLAAHLEGADLTFADVEGAVLNSAHLERASFFFAGLKGAYLIEAHLEGTCFEKVIVDGSTFLWECKVDRTSVHKRGTNFRGVSLDRVRIDPGTKQLLEYNIRRMNWQDYYKKHRIYRWPFQLFWLISNYGISTKRVIITFFVLAFFFAAIYANWAYWFPPGIVSNLLVEPHLPLWHYFILVFVRPVYFSIVTMTTLGFGDMYANKGSIAGHVILAVQVILGYVLLGALITRFAVLFMAGGPTGEFAEEKKKSEKNE